MRAEDWDEKPNMDYKKTVTMDPLTENDHDQV